MNYKPPVLATLSTFSVCGFKKVASAGSKLSRQKKAWLGKYFPACQMVFESTGNRK
jgi:hypothetical protein